MSDEIENQYPKIVYPGRGPKDRVLAVPGGDHGGVVVHNEDQEAWVMDGGNIDEFDPRNPKASPKAEKPAEAGFSSKPQ